MLLPELRARSAFWRSLLRNIPLFLSRLEPSRAVHSLPDGRGSVAKRYRKQRTNEWFVEGVYD